jgi:hypothetical protein
MAERPQPTVRRLAEPRHACLIRGRAQGHNPNLGFRLSSHQSPVNAVGSSSFGHVLAAPRSDPSVLINAVGEAALPVGGHRRESLGETVTHLPVGARQEPSTAVAWKWRPQVPAGIRVGADISGGIRVGASESQLAADGWRPLRVGCSPYLFKSTGVSVQGRHRAQTAAGRTH